jgi:hypothetical protein
MPKSKNRKNQKQKSVARTQKINAQQKSFQKKMSELMMKQIEEIRSQSSGETENQSAQDAGLIQSTSEL